MRSAREGVSPSRLSGPRYDELFGVSGPTPRWRAVRGSRNPLGRDSSRHPRVRAPKSLRLAQSQRTEPPSHARATDKRVRHAPFCQPGAWGPPAWPAQPSPRRPNQTERRPSATSGTRPLPSKAPQRGSAEPRRSDMSDEPSDRWKVRQPRSPSSATPPAPPSPSPTKPGGAPPKRDERNATASHSKRNNATTCLGLTATAP